MSIPVTAQPYVDKFRRYIKDEAAKNELLEAEENTDEYLYECLIDAVDEINTSGEPLLEYTLTTMPSWNLLKMGATLQYLSGAGIHSARNSFNYSDGSSINVQDTDTWGRYINYYNVLINKFQQLLSSFKRRENIDMVYGGVHSQYNDLW